MGALPKALARRGHRVMVIFSYSLDTFGIAFEPLDELRFSSSFRSSMW